MTCQLVFITSHIEGMVSWIWASKGPILTPCREDGNRQQVPAISKETIASVHAFRAVDQFYRDLTPVKQTLGMMYSIICPENYLMSRKIVENWRNKSAFCGIVHTEREFSTMTVLNTNIAAIPHTDKGDLETTMTMHSYGDYGRTKGGEVLAALLNKKWQWEGRWWEPGQGKSDQVTSRF